MVEHPEPRMGTEKEVLDKRIIAMILDVIIIGIIFAISGISGYLIASVFGSVVILVFLVIGLVMSFFYRFFLEGFMGQTLGKKVAGIVVKKKDGSDCTYLASFVRNLLRIVDGLLFYLVGIITIALTERNQRVGDRIANTVVVETSS